MICFCCQFIESWGGRSSDSSRLKQKLPTLTRLACGIRFTRSFEIQLLKKSKLNMTLYTITYVCRFFVISVLICLFQTNKYKYGIFSSLQIYIVASGRHLLSNVNHVSGTCTLKVSTSQIYCQAEAVINISKEKCFF